MNIQTPSCTSGSSYSRPILVVGNYARQSFVPDIAMCSDTQSDSSGSTHTLCAPLNRDHLTILHRKLKFLHDRGKEARTEFIETKRRLKEIKQEYELIKGIIIKACAGVQIMMDDEIQRGAGGETLGGGRKRRRTEREDEGRSVEKRQKFEERKAHWNAYIREEQSRRADEFKSLASQKIPPEVQLAELKRFRGEYLERIREEQRRNDQVVIGEKKKIIELENVEAKARLRRALEGIWKGIRGEMATQGQSPQNRNTEADAMESAALIESWAHYETQWANLHEMVAAGQPLTYASVPWPVQYPVQETRHVSQAAIEAFLLSPLHSAEKPRKTRLREALLRWHPDRFARWIIHVVQEDRDAVKEGVVLVASVVNALAGGDIS